MAARRARQIQNGANPIVDPQSRKPCRIAEQEIQAGRVKWEIPQAKTAAAAAEPEESPQGPVGGEADD